MELILFVVFVGLCILFVARMIWAEEATFYQRLTIVVIISDYVGKERAMGRFADHLYSDYASVRYDAHMWRLILGLNPMTLYSKEIQDLVRGKGVEWLDER